MQQLDLFGNPIDVKPPQKKKVEEKQIAIDLEAPSQTKPLQPKEENVDTEELVENHLSQDIHEIEKERTSSSTNIQQTKEEQETFNLQEPTIEQEPVEKSKQPSDINPVIFRKEKKAFKVPTGIIEEKVLKTKKEKPIKLPQKRGRKSIKEIEAEVDLIEIPEDEILFQKQYYAISTVADWFRVNTSLLRFWENEFDVLKPRKNRKGDRLFRPEDVKNLQLIYHLLREKKYTVEGAKDYLKSHKKKADTQLQLTQSLQKIKGFLLDMKANLQS